MKPLVFRSAFLFPLMWMGLISPLSAIGKMQETGNIRPDPYYEFSIHTPWNALPFVMQFLPSNPVVVDAGAFEGKESCQMARLWPEGQIHSFEPVQELYQRVIENTQSEPNIRTYKMALGDQCGQLHIYLSKGWGAPNRVGQSSSLYPPKEHLNYHSTPFHGTELVDVITLDAWAEKNNIDHVDLLWLDMQGYELPALKAAPKMLSKVSVIMTEVEFVEAYEGQPQYHEVKSWLESQGFVLIGGNFSFPKRPDQWFGDGLFVRKELLKN